mgnify:CR=1 FL=1
MSIIVHKPKLGIETLKDMLWSVLVQGQASRGDAARALGEIAAEYAAADRPDGHFGNELPKLAGVAADQAAEDMATIARGEEIDLPWRRLRVLIDYNLVRIVNPAILGGSLRGSRTSLDWTDAGKRFMGASE